MVKKKTKHFFFCISDVLSEGKQTNKQINLIIPASFKARNLWEYKDLRKMIEFLVTE